MKRLESSRSKDGSNRAQGKGKWYVPLERDEFTDACTCGFVVRRDPPERGAYLKRLAVFSPPVRVDLEMIHRAQLVLAEVSADKVHVSGDSTYVEAPLFLEDVRRCWVESADALDELEVQLESFEDTVPGGVLLAVDASLFAPDLATPPPAEPLGEGDDGAQNGAWDPANADYPEGRISLKEVEDSGHRTFILGKIAGGLAFLRWRAMGLDIATSDAEAVARCFVQNEAVAGANVPDLGKIGKQVYETLTGHQASNVDGELFSAACRTVATLSPKTGFEPIELAEDVRAACGGTGDFDDDLNKFVDTVRKVVGNLVEIRASPADDGRGTGRWAILAFLLAPNPDQTLRWIRSQRAGVSRNLSLLLCWLSGLYSGISGLSREVKCNHFSNVFSLVALARSTATGFPVAIENQKSWTDDASEVNAILVNGHPFYERASPPLGGVIFALKAARDAGMASRVDHATGQVFLSSSEDSGAIEGLLEARLSTVRLPADNVLVVYVHGRSSRQGGVTKGWLDEILRSSWAPVQIALLDSRGLVRLSVEVAESSEFRIGPSIRQALFEILQCVERLGVEVPTRSNDAAGISKKRRRTKPS